MNSRTLQTIRENTLSAKPGVYGHITPNRRWQATESWRTNDEWTLYDKGTNRYKVDQEYVLDSFEACQKKIDEIVLAEIGDRLD